MAKAEREWRQKEVVYYQQYPKISVFNFNKDRATRDQICGNHKIKRNSD